MGLEWVSGSPAGGVRGNGLRYYGIVHQPTDWRNLARSGLRLRTWADMKNSDLIKCIARFFFCKILN